jgi:DNA modification methylase
MIVREERIGGQRLLLGDCLAVMPLLGKVDAVVTDPPYGIGYASKGFAGAAGRHGRVYAKKKWDDLTPDLSVPLQMAAAAMVWGGNYFDLPPSRGWLLWMKPDAMPSFSDAEMCWTSLSMPVKSFSASMRAVAYEKADSGFSHPTQKPVALMEWCLGFLPDARTILDPFMGSGTTLVACQKMGRAGIGIEIDPDYFAIACKRVDEAARQPDMFVTPAAKPVQEGLPL